MKRLLGVILAFAAGAAGADTAPDGEALYSRNCSACHGDHGRGGVGVPLALGAFLTNVSDEYLAHTIRHGRPGRVMPAFTQLDTTEVAAIVEHIRSWMPEGIVRPAHDTTVVAGAAARGTGLYRQHCAACHGANGEGGQGTGVTFSRPRDLPVIAPALNNTEFLAAATDRMIKNTLMEGREGTPMTSFLDKGLTEKDIDDVVAYIRSFESDPIRWDPAPGQEAYLSFSSPYSLQETIENMKRAAVGKNFRIIRIQNLENGLFPEEKENPDQVIIYFCNFKLINDVLKLDPRVGMFMPCRVTAVEQDGEVRLMSINPKFMAKFFNNSALDQPCEQMYQTYVGIMEEATL